MPIAESEEENKWKLDHFKKTPIMPTYLLAFVVCDFKSKTKKSKRGTEVWSCICYILQELWSPCRHFGKFRNSIEYCEDKVCKQIKTGLKINLNVMKTGLAMYYLNYEIYVWIPWLNRGMISLFPFWSGHFDFRNKLSVLDCDLFQAKVDRFLVFLTSVHCQFLENLLSTAIQGGSVAEWFRALDLKSGGTWFNSSTLLLSGVALSSPEFNSSTALCK